MRSKIVLSYLSLYVIFAFFSCVPSKRKLPSALQEVSGVVRLGSGETFWINDGGNPAMLYRGGVDGFPIVGFDVSMKNVDWEALSPYSDSLLCICDIGDNRMKRSQVAIAIVNTRGEVLRQRNIYYPEQPFNAEACAIKGETLYVLTKAKFGKKGATKTNLAYLFTLDLEQMDSTMTLKDELDFPYRSITDMAWQTDDELVVLGYDFRRKAAFAKTPTTVYTVEVDREDHFRENTLRARKIKAPFTWTQYESILPLGNGKVLIASEKTVLFPPRWRIVSLP